MIKYGVSKDYLCNAKITEGLAGYVEVALLEDIKDSLIEWHKVEDGLPEPIETVWIYNESWKLQFVSMGHIDGSGVWWEIVYGHHDNYDVSHWAEIKPPTE